MVLRDETVRARLVALGFDVDLSTPAQLGETVAAELARWEEVIRLAGITFE